MSQQVLSGRARVGRAATTLAQLVEGPPDPALHAALPDLPWPIHDAEALRGVALLEESRLAGEHPDRLRLDHARLFRGVHDWSPVGTRGTPGRPPSAAPPSRPPVAPTGVPADAERALRRLLGQVAGAGLLPGGWTPDLPGVLRAHAALAAVPAAGDAARWHGELVSEHLLTWGARCLTRVQLGAQTFCYQGAAIVGLGVLRLAADPH
ncbi:hypothetical protein [Georgenia sp. H159]|uniref:hypothetical protein n=1 Tax=Georgenia sp. H159 TaxID=3076115 RepID=UPI002D76B010|nr:hypothetical protein [Georgenia sp. H159]